MTPRRRALAIPLTLCQGECSADPLLCTIHQQIEAAIVDAASVETPRQRPWTRKWAWLPEYLHDEQRYIWWEWFEQREAGTGEFPPGFQFGAIENRRPRSAP